MKAIFLFAALVFATPAFAQTCTIETCNAPNGPPKVHDPNEWQPGDPFINPDLPDVPPWDPVYGYGPHEPSPPPPDQFTPDVISGTSCDNEIACMLAAHRHP